MLVMLLLGFCRAFRSTWSATRSASGCARTRSSCRRSGSCRGSGLAYSLKFLWAPLVDKIDAPVLGRWLGRRRGWMLLAQIVVAVALVGMAVVQPRHRRVDDRGHRAEPVAGVRRAGAGGGVRIGDAGHRHRCMAHRKRGYAGPAGLADLVLDARLSRRVAGHRLADPDPRRTRRLVGVVRNRWRC